MDKIIDSQKAEQQPKQQNDFQQIMQAMQINESQLRQRIMQEQLISAQVNNIRNIADTLGFDLKSDIEHDTALTRSLFMLLEGYAITEPKSE